MTVYTTSSFTGIIGPLAWPTITSSNGSNTIFQNNVWYSPAPSGTSQTLTVDTVAETMTVTSNIPSNPDGIISFPCIEQEYSNVPLANYSSIICAWNESMNANSGAQCEAAFDCWLGKIGASTPNPGTEIMVWVDNHGQSFGSDPVLAHVTIDGIAYTIYRGGGSTEYIYSMDTTHTSGSIDILKIFNDATARGFPTSGQGIAAIEFGWEYATTGGSMTSVLNSYSITETLAGGGGGGGGGSGPNIPGNNFAAGSGLLVAGI